MFRVRVDRLAALLAVLALAFWLLPAPAAAQDVEFAPDLAIVDAASFRFEEEGRVLVLVVEVANLGANPSPEVGLVAFAWQEGVAAVPPLDPQESIVLEIALPIPAELAGTAQEIYIEIDPEQTFTDADRENNGTLTPPIDLPPRKEEGEALPDLAILSADEWRFEEGGRVLVLVVEISNLGDAPAPRAAVVVYSWEEASAMSSPLEPQERATVEVPVNLPPEVQGSASQLYVEVDPNQVILDSDRDNNGYQTPLIEFPPQGEPGGELFVEGVSPDRVGPGESFTLEVFGGGFRPGITVEVFEAGGASLSAGARARPGPGTRRQGVDLGEPTVHSESYLTVDARVRTDAEPGPRSIVVTNPDGLSARLDFAFEVAPRSRAGLLVLLAGGAVALALAAGGLALTVRLLSRPSRNTLEKRATEHDPPDECTPGRRWVKKTEIEVRPGRWRVGALTALTYDSVSGVTGARHQAPPELLAELNRAIGARRQEHDSETLAQELLPGAEAFAALVIGWQAAEPVARDVSLDAQLEGGEAEVQFEVYRCVGAPGKTKWVKERAWKASVKAARRHAGTVGGQRHGEPLEGYAGRARREVIDCLFRLVETVARM